VGGKSETDVSLGEAFDKVARLLGISAVPGGFDNVLSGEGATRCCLGCLGGSCVLQCVCSRVQLA
jgi:hypothetical protein